MVATPSEDLTLANIVVEKPVTVDYRRRGRTGLKMFGGYVFEEKLPQLQGKRGVDVYKEMGDTDALCGGILFAYDKMTRQVPWTTERATDHPNDRHAEEFLQECMADMSCNWTDFISEAMSFLQYGFDLHEILYKRRCGDSPESYLNSKYSDGRIGWKSFEHRAQNTVNRWLTNPLGDIVAVEQMAAPTYQAVVIPYDKLIHLRTKTLFGNPEGQSILRTGYRSWYLKRGIENIEAVGIERSVAGMPMIRAPSNVMGRESRDDIAMMDRLEEIVSNVKRHEGEGIIMPSDRDPANGQLYYEFLLTASPGSSPVDTDKVIQRHDQRIALSMMADFMLLGQGAGSSGSYAMHQDKTSMFTQALATMLDVIEQTINRHVIPRLFRLNNFVITDYPRIRHGRVGNIDLRMMSEYVRNLSQAGMPIFPHIETENYFNELGGMPLVKDTTLVPDISDPIGQGRAKEVAEVHEGDPSTGLPADEQDMTGQSPIGVANTQGVI